MATKDIVVNGTVYRCPVGWNVDQAEARIRSHFGLQFGSLEADGIPRLGVDLIGNIAGSLVFVGGQPVQVSGGQALPPLPPPASQDVTVAPINDSSASAIANTKREHYDCFQLPLSEDGYMPYQRIRSLMASVDKLSPSDNDAVGVALQTLGRKLVSMQSWGYPSMGSESIVNDPLLGELFQIMARSASDTDITAKRDNLPFKQTFLAKSAKAEHFLDVAGNHVLIGSEAKGVEKSHFHAFSQAFQVCGDSALNLYGAGLQREDCVVPGLVVAGESLKIVAVYLMAECFPVVVEISSYLSLFSMSGQEQIARWLVALSRFAVETAELLRAPGKLPRTISRITLSSKLFFKPIRNYKKPEVALRPERDSSSCRSALHRVMHMYKTLSGVEFAERFVLFPVGALCLPNEENAFASDLRRFLVNKINVHFKDWETIHPPLLVFPLLDSGWTNGKVPSDYIAEYKQNAQMIVTMLNDAGIAHMDLRPQNIMWKVTNGHLECQLIDLEDAVYFGHFVTHLKTLREDARYPVNPRDTRDYVRAESRANDWFLSAIIAYMDSERYHEESFSFSDFMRLNCLHFRDCFL